MTLSLVALVIVFRHSLACLGIQTYLNYKMKGYGGWHARYQRATLDRNGLAFHDVMLATHEAGATAQIDTCRCLIEWDRGLHMRMRFEIDHPSIAVQRLRGEGDFALASLMQGPLEKHRVDIRDGVVKFVDEAGEVQVYFSLEGDDKRRSVGVFYLSEEIPSQNRAAAMVKLYQWPQELIVESEFEQTSALWLTRIVKFFHPETLHEWEGWQGIVRGHSWIGFNDQGEVVQTTANIEVEDFECRRASGDLEVKIEEMSLDVSFPSGGKKIEKKQVWWQSLALKSMLKGGRARFQDQEWGADFTLSDIGGTLNFSTFKDSRIELKGLLDQGGGVSPIVLSGNPSLIDSETLDIDMHLFLEPENNTSTHLNLSISAAQRDAWLVRGRLKELDAPQIKMFQHLIGFAMPEVKDIHFNQGALTCELLLVIHEGKLDKLLLENLVGNGLELYWDSRDIAATAAELKASAQLDLSTKEEWRFPSWKVKLVDGEITRNALSNHPLKFSNIQSQIFMCRDVFEPSWIKGIVEDVAIDLHVVGFFSEANVKMNIATPLRRAVRFFDGEKQLPEDAFSDKELAANFDLHRQLGFWDVSGNVKLDVRGDWSDQIDVSFYLSDRILDYEELPLDILLQESISKGVVRANNISCEGAEVVRHFVGGEWDVEGMISFEGTFSAKSFDVDVESSYLNLTTPYLDVHLNNVLDVNELNTSRGRVHFDWEKGEITSYLPLYRSLIHEKGTGLQFSQSSGELFFDGRHIHFEGVNCDLEGLHLRGDVKADLLAPEGVEFRVITNEISGASSSLVKVVNHLESLHSLKFPFLGRISGGEESFSLKMRFSAEAPPVLDWAACLSLLHGTWEGPGGFSLSDLHFDFEVNSEDQKARVSNLLGNVSVENQATEYVASAKEIELDYSDSKGIDLVFDLRLENAVMDLVRLVGGYDGRQQTVFIEDDLSQIFGSKLRGVKLDLQDNHLPKELGCFFSMTGEEVALASRVLEDLGVGESITQWINTQSEQLSGKWEGQITYADSKWQIQLDGDQSVPISLNVKWNTEEVHIEKAHLGRMNVSGHLLKKEKDFVIEDLIVTIGDDTLAFDQGQWRPDERKVVLPLTNGNLHLTHFIQEGPKLTLDGILEVAFESSQHFPFTAAFRGDVVVDHVGDTSFTLASTSPIDIAYSQERGFLIKDSNFCLQDGDARIILEVPTLVFMADERVCQGYRIKTPLTRHLRDYLGQFTEFADTVQKISVPEVESEPPKLVFDFEYANDKIQVGGVLPRGTYHYDGKPYDLEETHFHFNDRSWEMIGGLTYFGEPFGFNVRVHPVNQYDTVIDVVHVDAKGEGQASKSALYAECRLRDEEGLSIQKIEGDLLGVKFHFMPQIDYSGCGDARAFLGNIKLDMDKLSSLLDGEAKMLVDELKLHQGYELSGKLVFRAANFEKPLFDGYFKGRDFDLLGVQLKTCFSKIRIDEQGIDVRDAKISDDAITVDIREMKFRPQKNGDYMVEVPEIAVHDLRPSLLEKRGKKRGRLRPFHIKSMVFHDVNGLLSSPKTLKGKGHLNFINTFKEGSNLLDIPLELISRLGLDIGLLVPIQGEMDYVLRDGKVVFTKLKNSFSENKRSYFYLWNKTESYVDLEGNMHIDIRMKQYVLFKITELFILSVNGTLDDPRFSLK